MIDLSICIVNWNTEILLKECLRSIYEQTAGISYEIFVVDNASQDGSVEMVSTCFPDVYLIANQQNKGFAAANNQALRLAKGRYVILLNPDTVLLGDALETMVQFMDRHAEAGAVGCKLLNMDGSIQYSTKRLLTSSIILYDNTILGRLPFLKGKLKEYKMKTFSFDKVEEVDAVSGAALMVRKKIFDEAGFMDEGYFMFFEDVDLCRRVRLKGYKLFLVPTAAIMHCGGARRHQNLIVLVMVSLRCLMRYVSKFESEKRLLVFKFFYKPLFTGSVIYDLFFDSLYILKYITIRKNPQKLKKRVMKIQRGLSFLKRDLSYFILGI